MRYTIERRPLSLKKKGLLLWRRRVAYKQPWALLESGFPIGFYLTAEDAQAACPEPVEIPA